MKFTYSNVVSKTTEVFIPTDIYIIIYKKIFSQEVLPELKNLQSKFKLIDERKKDDELYMMFRHEFHYWSPWKITNNGRNIEFVNKPSGPLTYNDTVSNKFHKLDPSYFLLLAKYFFH